MSIASYAELLSAVSDWADRTDIDARIPDFIGIFEDHVNSDYSLAGMETTATLTQSAGKYDLPSDLAHIRSVSFTHADQTRVLKPASSEAFDAIMPRSGSAPLAYYKAGNSLYIAPDNGTSLTLRYFAKLPALTSSNTTNWLLTAHPNAYLWGTLAEVFAYTRNEQDEANCRGRAEKILSSIQQKDTVNAMAGMALKPIGICP